MKEHKYVKVSSFYIHGEYFGESKNYKLGKVLAKFQDKPYVLKANAVFEITLVIKAKKIVSVQKLVVIPF